MSLLEVDFGHILSVENVIEGKAQDYKTFPKGNISPLTGRYLTYTMVMIKFVKRLFPYKAKESDGRRQTKNKHF